MGIEGKESRNSDSGRENKKKLIGDELKRGETTSKKKDIISFPQQTSIQKNKSGEKTVEAQATEYRKSLPPVETELNRLRGENVTVTPEAVSEKGFDPEAELKRTELSTDCVVDAYYGDMKRFPFLTEDERDELHQEVRDGVGSEERLRTLFYRLSTHDLFKDKEAHKQTGIGEEVDHDEVYSRVINDPRHEKVRKELLPGFDNLPKEEQEFLKRSCRSRSDYAQILQGQAPAALLESIHNEPDLQVRKFNILEAKFDIFGAAGHVNSEVALMGKSAYYRRMKNLDKALLDPNLNTPEERSNAFFDAEIAYFKGPVQPKDQQELNELRTLARLECHWRIEDKETFKPLQESFEVQPEQVKEILGAEMHRAVHPTLVDHGPALVRTIAEKEGKDYALTYYAHVLQEAHIADKEARTAGLPGISAVQIGDFVKSIKRGETDVRQTAIQFELQEGGLVAVPKEPNLVDISDLPEFTEGEALRGKRVIFVGEGGGSDGIQADMVGKLMAKKYGCEVACVASVRNEERQVTKTGQQIGIATKEITPETEAIGNWRFLEKIPLEGDSPTPTYILNSTDPEVIRHDITALIEATGAEVVIGVDTGGDSLYRNLHPAFSAHLPTDITPDQDYVVMQGLAAVAEEQKNVTVLSSIVAPGVDCPPYAREVLEETEASRLILDNEDVADINRFYAEKRMDGSGNEEGRYGKTPLAWLHALNGNTGLQVLDLPKANVISNSNPWRAFATITPAMAEIVLTDAKRHYAAIKHPHES